MAYVVFLASGVLLIGFVEEMITLAWVYYGVVMILFSASGPYFLN